MASASDETIPNGTQRDRLSALQIMLESSRALPIGLQRKSGMPPFVLTLVIMGVAAAVACLLAIAISSI